MLGLLAVLVSVMVSMLSTVCQCWDLLTHTRAPPLCQALQRPVLNQLWGHCWEELAVTSLTWSRKVFKSGP